MEKIMNALVECPSCEVPVKVENNVKLGETVICPACKANLEVVWLDPVELDVFYDDFDDDDYSDDDFDDDGDYEDSDY
jgi:lysine biosynthesis protein LysW